MQRMHRIFSQKTKTKDFGPPPRPKAHVGDPHLASYSPPMFVECSLRAPCFFTATQVGRHEAPSAGAGTQMGMVTGGRAESLCLGYVVERRRGLFSICQAFGYTL